MHISLGVSEKAGGILPNDQTKRKMIQNKHMRSDLYFLSGKLSCIFFPLYLLVLGCCVFDAVYLCVAF